MEKLTKIERFRVSSTTSEKLNQLHRFGKKKSKFIREAVEEKLRAEVPKLFAEENKRKNLDRCPF